MLGRTCRSSTSQGQPVAQLEGSRNSPPSLLFPSCHSPFSWFSRVLQPRQESFCSSRPQEFSSSPTSKRGYGTSILMQQWQCAMRSSIFPHAILKAPPWGRWDNCSHFVSEVGVPGRCQDVRKATDLGCSSAAFQPRSATSKVHVLKQRTAPLAPWSVFQTAITASPWAWAGGRGDH